jgi:hypothetical protein
MIAPIIAIVVLVAAVAWLEMILDGMEVRASARERGLYDE